METGGWAGLVAGGAEQGASNTAADPRPELAAVWIPDRGEDERPAASRILALRTAGRLCGRTCAGLPRTLDNPPARAKWGATIRPPTTSPCARSLAPCRLDAPRLRFPPRELGRFGAAAAAAALRLHNRRLGGVLGRLKGRSSILGHYSGSNAWGVRTFRLGGCRESPVVCERLSYAVSRPLPPSRPFRGCPLPREAIPNSPLAIAHPACVRPVALPPTGQYYPAQSPRVGLTSAPAGESGERPRFPPVPHCQGLHDRPPPR